MVWSETGFLGNMGVLDFAGGTPVHSKFSLSSNPFPSNTEELLR